MATTPDLIINAALAKNRKNQPGVIATPTEIFETFLRVWPVFWIVAARINPTFFGSSSTVSKGASGWARPSKAELLFRIEDPNANQVIVVDMNERDAEPSRPAVYEWGQVFKSAGNANDPTSGNLTFFYSKRPDAPVDKDANLDSLWPEDFNDLLVLELAITLAMKDERYGEVDRLKSDRDARLSQFLAHLEHATVGVVRTMGQLNAFQDRAMVPLSRLLAGGTEVDFAA